MNAYLKARRRAGCDGSVIALTFLVKQEFGIDITFEDGLCGTRRYIKQRGENLKGAVLGQWYIYGRDESTSKGYDYTVHAPGADAETRSRIYSVINIYNSAGFSFTVIE